jgi:hypothetical protein
MTGPWADEFQRYYAEAKTDIGRSMLADGRVSDMEFAEAMSIIEECYANDGFTVEYDEYGFETVTATTGTEDPLDEMGKCAFADDGAVVLFYQVQANPDNTDQETLIAECLGRAGLVERGFSREDFIAATETEKLPWDRADPLSAECFRDPLGLVGEE